MDSETQERLDKLFQQGIKQGLITEEGLRDFLTENRLIRTIVQESGKNEASNFIGII